MQEFTAPISGDYKLEVWGAQGSGGLFLLDKSLGGLGGYSKGIAYILENTIISVCVGGEGNQSDNFPRLSTNTGGYNGGGFGQDGGGGATHIATTNRGELYEYENHKDEVYIVAGGGGACDGETPGGFGGGENGGDGIYTLNKYDTSGYGRGGTQTSGGIGGNSGAFGRGGDSYDSGSDSGGGGGGGWYGGGGCWNVFSPGGGGSGYINTTLITNGVTIAGDQTFPSPSGGTEQGHRDHGYAIITWQQLP